MLSEVTTTYVPSVDGLHPASLEPTLHRIFHFHHRGLLLLSRALASGARHCYCAVLLDGGFAHLEPLQPVREMLHAKLDGGGSTLQILRRSDGAGRGIPACEIGAI